MLSINQSIKESQSFIPPTCYKHCILHFECEQRTIFYWSTFEFGVHVMIIDVYLFVHIIIKQPYIFCHFGEAFW